MNRSEPADRQKLKNSKVVDAEVNRNDSSELSSLHLSSLIASPGPGSEKGAMMVSA
ncbi:MAG: hypothetical protein GX089_01995 [Fibrobacter sp.]|nr:hypothetical protein [Fibrobacter sp.]